jgi:hypothetical protein
MHDQITSATADEDHHYEERVLRHVLNWQPTILRLCDLIREVARDPGEFGHRDAVERAVRELTKVGLLHRHGDCVLPTTAATYVCGMDLG